MFRDFDYMLPLLHKRSSSMVPDNNPFKRRKETVVITEHVTQQFSQVTECDKLEVVCIRPTQTSMEVENGNTKCATEQHWRRC